MDNALGFFATLTYVATLLPSNFKVVFPAFKYTSFYRALLKNRRAIGLWTFVFSVAHVCVIFYQQHLDLSAMEFYRKSLSGLLLLSIFTLLAITSNNWSIRKLQKNWKRLHSLTYAVAFLLPWHITAKMGDEWSIVTALCMVLAANVICIWTFRQYRALSHQASFEGLTRYFYLRFLMMSSASQTIDYKDNHQSHLDSMD